MIWNECFGNKNKNKFDFNLPNPNSQSPFFSMKSIFLNLFCFLIELLFYIIIIMIFIKYI